MGSKKATPGETEQETIARLKREWLAYYRELPIKRAAGDFIGRSADAVANWEKEDPEFASDVLKARADYAKKHGKGRPAEILPKLYDEFKPEKTSDGPVATAITINYVQPLDRLPALSQTGSGVAVPDQPNDD